MKGKKILFMTAIDGKNVHEWGTVHDTIVKDGNTLYLTQYKIKTGHGTAMPIVLIKPEEIESIED